MSTREIARTRSLPVRLVMLVCLLLGTFSLPAVTHLVPVGAGFADDALLQCGTATLVKKSESKGFVVHTCSGSGIIDYTVHCLTRANQQFSVRYTSGMSLYYPYDCGTGGLAWKVSYSVR